MNLEAVMPMSAWWALAITIAVLATIIEARTNDYGAGELFLRFGRWVQLQFGLWFALFLSVCLITWVLP